VVLCETLRLSPLSLQIKSDSSCCRLHCHRKCFPYSHSSRGSPFRRQEAQDHPTSSYVIPPLMPPPNDSSSRLPESTLDHVDGDLSLTWKLCN